MSDVAARAWPEPHAGLGSFAAAMVCAIGAVCAFAVAGLAWTHGAPAVPAAMSEPAPAAPPPPAPWLDIIKPVQIFSFEAPPFRSQEPVYAARRQGDVREDTIAYGTVAGDTPMLRLALLRGAAAGGMSLDDGLARLAGRQGITATLGTRRGALTTRFGRFETAIVRLPGRATACDGFHLALASPALVVDGLACGTTRADLACLIDRLDLASAGDDHALADLFAVAELRRNPACRGMRLGPDVAHAPWLNDKRATPPRKMRP